MEAFGMPGFVVKAGGKVSKGRLGFDVAEPNFVENAPKTAVPTPVVRNTYDPWAQMNMVEDRCNALTVEKELKLLDIEKSRCAPCGYPDAHCEELMGWFDQPLVTPTS